MRVGINLRPTERTGTGRVQQEIVARLGGAPIGPERIEQVTVFCYGRRDPRLDWLPLSVDYARATLPGRAQHWLSDAIAVPVEWLFPLNHPDVIHTLSMELVRTRCPLVGTILDVSWRHFPGTHETFISRDFVRSAEALIARATHLHAISQATADDLIAGGIPSTRITVSRLGVDARFREVTPADRERVKRRYSLPDEFLLYVGAINIRKNFPLLAGTLNTLSKPVPLVAVGPIPSEGLEHWGCEAPRVIHLGVFPDDDLPALYGCATALVFPSVCEGFGLPLVEAMAAGTPVIASDIAVFREVGGGVPSFFDPAQVDSLGNAIERVWGDEDLRTQMSSAGVARSRLFSWDLCAEGVVEAYRQALRSRRP